MKKRKDREHVCVVTFKDKKLKQILQDPQTTADFIESLKTLTEELGEEDNCLISVGQQTFNISQEMDGIIVKPGDILFSNEMFTKEFEFKKGKVEAPWTIMMGLATNKFDILACQVNSSPLDRTSFLMQVAHAFRLNPAHVFTAALTYKESFDLIEEQSERISMDNLANLDSDKIIN